MLIFGLLALDLGVFHKKDKAVSFKECMIWTGVWVGLALAFGGVVYLMYDVNFMDVNPKNVAPSKAMLDYYTGYVIEESLSLDNIFVIAMIFKFFKIDAKYQHNILFWGILGAVFFRLGMILVGAAFLDRFEWAIYIFGGILIISALKMLKSDDENENFRDSFAVRVLSKIYKIDWTDNSGTYFIRKDGKRYATTLFAALIVVEFSDILFAVDSIPAIFSVTRDPFIIFSSNVFAILGLRNLYFFLANMIDRFHYIKYALVVVLLYVGVKMIIIEWVHIPTWISLVTILGALLIGTLASLAHDPAKKNEDNT